MEAEVDAARTTPGLMRLLELGRFLLGNILFAKLDPEPH
jgi:hypothetical protein